MCLKQIFLKVANGLSILSKKKKKNECDTVALMISGKLIWINSVNNIFQLLQGIIT